MKKTFLTSVITLLTSLLFSQNYCGSARYDTPVFPSVTITSNVIYGTSIDVASKTDTLKMDIYQPTGDTASIRPVIVMAHGGSFVGGDKSDMAYLCTEFAKRGYVTATINYRLGLGFPVDSIRTTQAVWRATADMKAAVRYFSKDAATTNTYKIDPNMIIIGGASAGGIMAVHYAYLDQVSEIPACIDTNLLGGMEGNSGNPGYSSAIKAVVNICGAIADTSWMHAGDEPMVSMQGNNDNTVPYCTNVVYLLNFKIMIIHGLGTMVIKANEIGLDNPVHTFYGQGHSSPADTFLVSGGSNIDTTMALASQFLYKQLGCTSSITTDYTNTPLCLTTIGINEVVLNSENVSLFPNPAIENIALILKEVKGNKFNGEIFDITGRKINEFNFTDKNYLIKRNRIQPGIYFLKLKSDVGEVFTTKIIFSE